MSQYVLHGIDDVEVEVEIDMADYDFQVKYEKAFEQMQEEEKALQKQERTLKLQKDIVRCSIICLTIFLEKAFQRSSLVENIIL